MGLGLALAFLPVLLAAPITPRQIARLPEWAAAAAREAAAESPPDDADAWVLLQRTELVYEGEGKVRARQLRLVLVLSERGLGERTLRVAELSGKGSKLKRIKGLNSRPEGDVEELERRDAISLDDGQYRVLTAKFERAMKGSLLATESIVETDHPLGPDQYLTVMEANPVRQWSLEVRSEKAGVEVGLDHRHLAPWGQPASHSANSLLLRDLPARPQDESLAPHERNVFPWVHVSFHDPTLQKDVPAGASWDRLAAWVQAKYAAHFAAVSLSKAEASDAKSTLKAIHDWMSQQLTYRQVYLTPERGWIPSSADDVARRQYGDCKDLATFLISEARAAGLQAYPVLARIAQGYVEDGEPPNVYAFNHVIAAVRLPATLGLAAEIETGEGRFLLADATGRFTPFGQLSDAHAGRRLLICLERGGVWVTVPESATSKQHRRFKLEGQVDRADTFKGTLEVREEGLGEGLRSLCVMGGAEALRKFCLGQGLPPDARCDVNRQSDPHDLGSPYEVVFGLEYRLPVRLAGTHELRLDPPGFPRPAEPIQKPGQPRRLPVTVEGRSSFDYEIHVKVPWSLAPVVPNEHGETAFRTYAWTALVRNASPGSELDFQYSQQRLPRSFDFDHREEGVAAWKKDRSVVRRLREEALAFKTP